MRRRRWRALLISFTRRLVELFIVWLLVMTAIVGFFALMLITHGKADKVVLLIKALWQ